MPQATADLFSSPCLQFKGSMVPLTTLELLYFDQDKLSRDLAEKVKQAPKLFANLPLILSLEKLSGERDALDLALIRQICTAQGTQLVGIRTKAAEDIELAEQAGLAILQPGKARSESVTEALQDNQEPSTDPNSETGAAVDQAPVEAPPTVIHATNRIVKTPIRSGQQIYAKGGDLIVMAPVSAGAEILADGNIHVYAPLRGRALAGVQGDTQANIFCQSLEAELVSIAGQYKISEDLQGGLWKKAARIALVEDRLTVSNLV